MFVNDDCILGYLEDVWYVPDFVANISVRACLDKGYTQMTDARKTTFMKNGHMMAECISLSDELFAIHMHEVIPSDPKVTKCYSADAESLQLWHERLGHQSKSHIKSFLKGLGYDVIMKREIL